MQFYHESPNDKTFFCLFHNFYMLLRKSVPDVVKVELKFFEKFSVYSDSFRSILILNFVITFLERDIS